MFCELVCLNGIYAESGDYLLPPMSPEQVAKLARQDRPPDVSTVEHFRIWADEVLRGRAVMHEPDTSDLSKVGWGLIFAAGEPPERVRDVTQALDNLIALRKSQAGEYFKICQGEQGYHKGDLREEFLLRHGAPPAGRANPEKLPYYLLIVGDPETIPYEFQYQLDVQYAVGRIWFEELVEYSRYARSVVAAEGSRARERRRAVFFAPSNPQDPASHLSAMDLAKPLAEWARKRHAARWSIESFLATDASRERLQRLLGGEETPDFLFTAGHGLVYPLDHPQQKEGQGALVCQEWSGPKNPVYPNQCFAAKDLDPHGDVGGLITFHFACDSAGTSKISNFAPGTSLHAAKESFIAPLPQRLLAHPNGGALAVIGHVGGAWKHSIQWPDAGRHIEAFEEVVEALMVGKRVGAALEAFGMRYADQAVSLSDLLEQDRDWGGVEEKDIVRFWLASHDTRNFIVLGDPAVRLNPAPSPR
jgi:hypothetical protein